MGMVLRVENCSRGGILNRRYTRTQRTSLYAIEYSRVKPELAYCEIMYAQGVLSRTHWQTISKDRVWSTPSSTPSGHIPKYQRLTMRTRGLAGRISSWHWQMRCSNRRSTIPHSLLGYQCILCGEDVRATGLRRLRHLG